MYLNIVWVSQRAITVSLHDNNDDNDDDASADNHEAKPKAAAAAAMKVDADSAVKTAGVDKASAASGGVRIAGAMGPNGTLINGMYEATNEMSGDMPVYVKVGNTMICAWSTLLIDNHGW